MNQVTPVVTVTLNPAIDQTIAIPHFTAGAVNRVQSSQLDPGGKGINVASFLTDYGQPVTVTGFLGADNDTIFTRFFAAKGIEDRFIRIAGQTRTGVKVVDDALGQTTDINFPGPTPASADVERLFNAVRDLADTHEWFVLAGSIPPGVDTSIYRDLVALLAGKRAVLDTSGEALRQAAPAGPWLIKPNVHELEEFVGRPLETAEAMVAVARDLMQRHGITSVVVSMGKEGALFVEGDEVVWAVPPAALVKSTVGAGDAMVAGIVAAKTRGLSLAETARLATAFSVSAISHIGSGLPSLEAVRAAQGQVTLREVSKTSVP